MSRRVLIALVVTFGITRAVVGYLADHPDHYAPAQHEVVGDSNTYETWSWQILRHHLNPYSEVGIEYPPGALPFVVAPGVTKPSTDTYRTRFILLMITLDLLAFVALLVLARRWGSALGPWLWVGVVPLLGPIAYNRLDLLPAVATILAVERLSARSWFAAGGWLGYGVVAKVYPALFLPIAFAATRRRQLIGGAVLIGVLFLVPYIGFLDDVYRNVIGYHIGRGIQIESLWGFVLLSAARLGHEIVLGLNFGARHVSSTMSPAIEAAAQILCVGVLVVGVWLAHRLRQSGRDASAPEIAGVMFMTMAGTMALGTVFSPQFMLWLGALGAAALCERGSSLRVPALAVLPVAAITQLVYPFLYEGLLGGESAPLFLLGIRNVLVLFVAGEAFLALRARVGRQGARTGDHSSGDGGQGKDAR